MKKTIFTWAILLLSLYVPAQNRYDIVIDEIMADPSPSAGLPENEWLELKNTSAVAINLQNWRIGDGTGQSGPFPNFILQPDSFLIVCTSTAVAAMSSYGTTVAVTSFPSLDNDGDQLFLKAASGKIIHAVSYTSQWYRNELKKEGGWTLEMIDPKNPCAGSSNWRAAVNGIGGSPGKKNSIDALNIDQTGPQLKRAFTSDSITVVLIFDESLDSLKGATATNYSIDGGLTIKNALTSPPLFNQVILKVNTPLTTGMIYTITASAITDCKNNVIGAANYARTGLATDAGAGEWVINEILFHPGPNAFDYAEFYNKSNKLFDAARLYVANRNSAGLVSSIKALSTVPFTIFPGDHIVVTEDAGNLALNYLVKNPDQVLVIPVMPAFPVEQGIIIAMNARGIVTDEVHYNENWHFKLLNNNEGVALERIDPAGLSQDAANWHSAASTAGYGTPTYKNSQYKQTPGINATIEVVPKVFSPDNDGLDDIATIQYQVSSPGYIATITIFDGAGRPVRSLVRNGTMGSSGYWNWDGLNDKGLKLPVGTYIILAEIFDLGGRKNMFKKAVVVARKLN